MPTVRAPAVVHLGEPSEVPQAQHAPRRAWPVLALVLVLAVGTALVGAPAASQDVDLLGHLTDATGRSSRLPPADDLQVLWRRPLDLAGSGPAGPPVLWQVGGTIVVGRDVVPDPQVGASMVWPVGAVPTPDGDLLLADGAEVVTVEPSSGRVRTRAEVVGPDGWRPRGVAIGWLAGAAVFRDAAGVLGAVVPSGAVRWVAPPTWDWDGTGHGTDWAVVTVRDVGEDRRVVVNGRDGGIVQELGPVRRVLATAVLGDTAVWVEAGDGAAGVGQQLVVRGLRLDGTGGTWAVTDLPPTVAAPGDADLVPTDDAVVLHFRTAGQATTAVWLEPRDGRELGRVAVVGAGETAEGWPLAAVVGDAVVHVSPVREELRVVDRAGIVRWRRPAAAGEGVLAAGDVVLVHTPQWVTPTVAGQPRGAHRAARVRLLEAGDGRSRWERATAGGALPWFDATLAGHVGVTGEDWPASVQRQAWFAPDTGRRASGTRLAAAALGVSASADLTVVGRLAPPGGLVLARQDGRLVTTGPRPAVGVADLLAGGAGGGRAPGDPTATVQDPRLAVSVAAAAVTAAVPGAAAPRWRAELDVALDAAHTVLLEDVVVVTGLDGSVLALDRRDGRERWRHTAARITALTAGGDRLVAGTASGELLVVDREGAVRQTVRLGAGPVHDVAVVDGRVVAALDGEVVGLGRGAFFVEPRDRVDLR